MKKLFLLFTVISFLTIKSQAQTITDYDGNVYHTLTFGTQMWLKENLKVTHYNNGTLIPNVKISTSWSSLTTGARCYYGNDSVTFVSVYGALYNWYAVADTQNLCPAGWHVPTSNEWMTLHNYLILNGYCYNGLNDNYIAKALSSDSCWAASVTPGAVGNTDYPEFRNKSGFTAYPGGCRDFDGSFDQLSVFGYWWTSTAYDSQYVNDRYICYDQVSFFYNMNPRKVGFSVRCLSDEAVQVNEINNKIGIEIYPNPAYEKLFVNNLEQEKIDLAIYNILGELVMQKELISGINVIDIRDLSKGLYVIQTASGNNTQQIKLMKQ